VKELRADVNKSDDEGWTALAWATYFDHHDTARYLVEELGADVNIPDNGGWTPLSLAASKGHFDVIRLLLRLGAGIDPKDDNGMTPLMIASAEKHYTIVKWLVKAGADTQNAEGSVTAVGVSREASASAEQTSYLESKMHCSNASCSGAGIMKCTGCKQARYCAEACQLAHWKAHKANCKRWRAEMAAGMGS
jgi:hypothetical protein